MSKLLALLIVLTCGRALAQGTADVQLALVDLKGAKQILGVLPGSVFAPRVSPDGKRVVFELGEPLRLWVAELAHLDRRRALPPIGTGRNWAAVWSPDGQSLVFQASDTGPDAGPDKLYLRRADGSGEAQFLVDGRAPEGLSADGQRLVFITRTANRDYGISLLDIGTGAVTPLVDRPDSEQHSSRIAPDGRWLAYASNETGQQEVWVEPLPPTGKRYRITQSGGRHPLWSPDGKYLYFDQDGRMFRVEVFLGAEAPKIGAPKQLPIAGFVQGELRRQFDLLPNGRQFLLLYPLTAR